MYRIGPALHLQSEVRLSWFGEPISCARSAKGDLAAVFLLKVDDPLSCRVLDLSAQLMNSRIDDVAADMAS